MRLFGLILKLCVLDALFFSLAGFDITRVVPKARE